MKCVVFSDLHLDAQFGSLGSVESARRRRESLRRALLAIAALARQERADALLCGGDLYEHERFTPDTGAFLQRLFADLHPLRVFLAPGNHDYYAAASLYRRTAWSANVHVFTEAQLTPVTLSDGLTLWGAAHHAPSGTGNLLDRFTVDRGGVHMALFHGSERGGLFAEGEDKLPHAPFDAAELDRAGIHHAFLGHYHSPRDAGNHTYPGNPEPFGFGERGPRGAVVVTIRPDGRVDRDRRRVAAADVCDERIDVTGAVSRQEIAERAMAILGGRTGLVRITLEGELRPEVELVPRELERDLAAQCDGVEVLRVRAGALRAAYDFDAIAAEPTVRGAFVRGVREAGELDDAVRRRVLQTGLRALDGRMDLEVT